MPVTFGSVGDIIAVGILVKDLAAALNQSRGSQAEYKQVVAELHLLQTVLGRIDYLCNTAGTWTASRRLEVTALHDTTLRIAQNCRKLIEVFSVRLKKYDKILGGAGALSKSEKFKATVAKVRWQIGEKEDVVRFRAEIASQTAALNLALGATTWSVGKDNQEIMKKFEDDTGNHLQAQHEALAKVSNTITETNTLVSQMNTLSGQVVNGLAKIVDLCTQAKTTMSKILFVNIATYKMVLALKTSLPGYLERSLYSEPFILEDAIGRISPVHLQFISSWEALDAVIETRFRGLQGHDKIQSGHWTLQDHATGREISRRRNWEGAFLPGQRVDMSLLFTRETIVESFGPSAEAPPSDLAACPRCQADVSDSCDVETHWYARQYPAGYFKLTLSSDTCGLCFRRIVEIEEVDPKPTPPTPKPWLNKPTFGTVSFKPMFGPQLVELKRRRGTDDFDISGFKRIQILSKESRVKRHVFHPMPRKAPRPHSSQPQVASNDNPFDTIDGMGPVRLKSQAGTHTLLTSSSVVWQPTVGNLRERRDSDGTEAGTCTLPTSTSVAWQPTVGDLHDRRDPEDMEIDMVESNVLDMETTQYSCAPRSPEQGRNVLQRASVHSLPPLPTGCPRYHVTATRHQPADGGATPLCTVPSCNIRLGASWEVQGESEGEDDPRFLRVPHWHVIQVNRKLTHGTFDFLARVG